MTNLTKITFDEVTVQKVWEKSAIISGYDATRYRKDLTGAWIERNKYGDTSIDQGLGWEVDHRKPIAKGGTNILSNLRPLQWKNNRSKGENFPYWQSTVGSEDNNNVNKVQNWKEN